MLCKKSIRYLFLGCLIDMLPLQNWDIEIQPRAYGSGGGGGGGDYRETRMKHSVSDPNMFTLLDHKSIKKTTPKVLTRVFINMDDLRRITPKRIVAVLDNENRTKVKLDSLDTVSFGNELSFY